MSNEARSADERIFQRLDEPEYPQPIVSTITGAALQDLTAWRRRGIIDAQATDRRVLYSGRSVLRIAVIEDLAWVIGPARASMIAADLDQLFERIAANGLTPHLYDHLVILRPEGGYESAKPSYLPHFDNATISEDAAVAMPWTIVDRSDLSLEAFGRAAIMLPLGRVLLRTSLRAAAMLGGD
jgi:hypothetical protein